MSESFFGLNCEPFTVAANPRFIYMSRAHRQAHAHLHYGLRRGAGFILLTGDIGAGKTTVSRLFLRQLPPTDDVVYIVDPTLDARALLLRICQDLRIEVPPDGIDLIDAIYGHILLASAAGRRTLIVVDEAQALSNEALEKLRLLTNLDSNGGKIQVFLIGQPELREMLKEAAHEALAQRLVTRFHLTAMPEDETRGYIEHRLQVAGLSGPVPFDQEAQAIIHRVCGGVPRRINVLCDRAMHLAEMSGTSVVDRELVLQAAADVFDTGPELEPAEPMPQNTVPSTESPRPAGGTRWPVWIATGLGGLICGVILTVGHRHGTPSAPRQLAAPAAVQNDTTASTAPAAPPFASASPVPAPLATETSTPAPPAGASPAPPPTATATSTPAPPAGGPAPSPATGTAAREATVGLVRFTALQEGAFASETAAWNALGRLWGVDLGSLDPCGSARRHGLRCYQTTGGSQIIRMLDRPGIIKLSSADGRAVRVLIEGIDDTSVTILNGTSTLRVALSDLAGHWYGDFATLWRAPKFVKVGTQPNVDASSAKWLDEYLPPADATSSTADSGHALESRLSAYQLQHQLEPDGKLGPRTLMQLSRDSGSSEPRLLATR